MTRFRLAVGRTASGMTLLEVLAAVFCLGMGLIMVAGAFPAAAHQTRLTVQQTEASLMAASAADYVAVERRVRELTKAQVRGSNAGPLSIALNIDEEWMVWNPERLPYLDDFDERKLLPPGGGDFVLRPFLTRVSGNDEAPLYRMTIVVGRYSNQAPDFYDVELMKDGGPKKNPGTGTDSLIPPGVRYLYVSSVSGNVLTGDRKMNPVRYIPSYVTDDHFVNAGDYVMNPRTGHCYRIVSVDNATDKVTLAETPSETLESRRNYYLFRNVVGVFYQLISD
jgi:hypothetical protein